MSGHLLAGRRLPNRVIRDRWGQQHVRPCPLFPESGVSFQFETERGDERRDMYDVDDVGFALRDCHGRRGRPSDLPDDGQISANGNVPAGSLSSPSRKNILLFRIFGISYIPPRPVPPEGRCATSSTRGGMRWTLMVLLTRALDADGEVAWS
jgi:hypothetical protein